MRVVCDSKRPRPASLCVDRGSGEAAARLSLSRRLPNVRPAYLTTYERHHVLNIRFERVYVVVCGSLGGVGASSLLLFSPSKGVSLLSFLSLRACTAVRETQQLLLAAHA